MKKLQAILVIAMLSVSSCIFAEAQTAPTAQTAPVDQKQIQLAREGCQKPIGFFPTPSKLMCLLTALGKTEKDIKPKAMAIVFSACQGRLSQPQPAGVTAKKYASLGACLADPAGIQAINKELAAQGFGPIIVVNSTILSAPAQ